MAPITAVVRSDAEIETVIISLGRDPRGGLVVAPSPFLAAYRALIISLAARNNVPAVYYATYYVRDGGLVSYGADRVDMDGRAASYIDRILRGEKPAELPVQVPTKYEMSVNLKTAKALGLTVPQSILLRAGEVIASVFAKKNPQATGADLEVEKKRLIDAPLVIGVVSFTRPHPKVPAYEQELSAGASAMNIVTAATALGYGACWLSGWYMFDRDVLDGFGLKPDERLAGLIHIGTPAKPNEDRPRPVLSEIVTRF